MASPERTGARPLATNATTDPAATLVIGADHAGFALKARLIETLKREGVWSVDDFGVFSEESADYPDVAHRVASAIAEGRFARGILVCGSGIGVSIVANRHKGVRAALCTDTQMAEGARRHNDANVLCLGSRVTDAALAQCIVQVFLREKFEAGRHARRVGQIEC